MNYPDKKNQELRELYNRLSKQLEDMLAAANHELKNPNLETLSGSAIGMALGELGFERAAKQPKRDAELWIRDRDQRSILIPKQDRNGKAPARSRKRKVFTIVGVLVALLSVLLFLAQLGALGPMGDGLQHVGQQMISADPGDSIGLLAVIGTIVGFVLIGIGVLFEGAQKVYDYGTTALDVYHVSSAAMEWVSNASSGYDIAAIDREFERISKEATEIYDNEMKRMATEFNKLRGQQIERMKTHYLERFRTEYNL